MTYRHISLNKISFVINSRSAIKIPCSVWTGREILAISWVCCCYSVFCALCGKQALDTEYWNNTKVVIFNYQSSFPTWEHLSTLYLNFSKLLLAIKMRPILQQQPHIQEADYLRCSSIRAALSLGASRWDVGYPDLHSPVRLTAVWDFKDHTSGIV